LILVRRRRWKPIRSTAFSPPHTVRHDREDNSLICPCLTSLISDDLSNANNNNGGGGGGSASAYMDYNNNSNNMNNNFRP
jgi:hypothetical protein